MLRELLSKDMRKLAGAVYYARGKEYFEQGLVSSLKENDDEITACVEGTHTIMRFVSGRKAASFFMSAVAR